LENLITSMVKEQSWRCE